MNDFGHPGTCTKVATVLLTLLLAKSVVADLTLVEQGQSRAVIVGPPAVGELQRIAIIDFQKTIRRASGAEIPLVTAEEATELPETTTRIVLGPSPMATELGCDDDLLPEEYRIKTVGDAVVVLANDIQSAPRSQDSLVTTWALAYLLENYVGVRWLWPGELGTVVPRCPTIRLPTMDLRRQPVLVRRSLNINAIRDITHEDPDALKLWAAHHQVAGERVKYRFAHSFRQRQSNGDWWGRFHQSQPNMLARGPDGNPGFPNNRPHFVKICISNPAVTTEILRLWTAAGQPDFWDVTPNDGNAFCTCENCRALDLKYGGVSYSKEEIWRRPDHVSLTDRYVWFWNQLVRKMRKQNPRVKIGVYFYSAYRNPPRTLRLEDGIIGEIVHGYDFGFWKAWQAVGAAEIGLRPNWWHMGANAPHLPMHHVGHYIEQARDGGMRWIKMDTLMEYWATQGPYYYLLARLIARPDLKTDQVIEEYCDSFGTASKSIRRYLDFWETYHERVAYNIPAGGKLSQDADGLYEQACRQAFGDVAHPLKGHWMTMPMIYTPQVLADADQLLIEARSKAETDDVRRRIEFLRDGLVQVAKTVDVVKSPKTEHQVMITNLTNFAKKSRAHYGYWGHSGAWALQHWGVLDKNVKLEGM